jgi:hypothetical protein
MSVLLCGVSIPLEACKAMAFGSICSIAFPYSQLYKKQIPFREAIRRGPQIDNSLVIP